ncbi:MAG TPA: tetratricopeptide repeat protein [Polyangiaceae bacterium]|nr:tetratricopeptide repeat protein [Polyangiaceae bacterium]
MKIWAALAMLTAGGVALFGCGGPDYGEAFVTSFHAAKRAYAAGRYAEAAALYGEAAGDAQRVKDRDEAFFMQARMYEKLERYEAARERYETILKVSPRGTRAGRAAFEIATLQIEHGDPEKGWKALEEAIRRYPNHGSARRGLELWAEHVGERDGEEALRAVLARWLVEMKGSVIEQQLRYERARSFRRGGDLAAAHAAFVETARHHPYPMGTLTDDAWWFASLVAEERGDYEQAVADLRSLLASREVATGGSYERPRYPHAQMRIAELYRDRLGDRRAAMKAFRRVYEEHETSILADDAMWWEAVLERWDGDSGAACDLGEDLRERFPSSRYLRCLDRLCSTLPAQGSRPCPSYILETLAAGSGG